MNDLVKYDQIMLVTYSPTYSQFIILTWCTCKTSDEIHYIYKINKKVGQKTYDETTSYTVEL